MSILSSDELECITSTFIADTGDEESEGITPASLTASEPFERLKFYISTEGEEYFTGQKGGINEDN